MATDAANTNNDTVALLTGHAPPTPRLALKTRSDHRVRPVGRSGRHRAGCGGVAPSGSIRGHCRCRSGPCINRPGNSIADPWLGVNFPELASVIALSSETWIATDEPICSIPGH